MTDLYDAAGVAPAAASTSSGRELSLPGWAGVSTASVQSATG